MGGLGLRSSLFAPLSPHWCCGGGGGGGEEEDDEGAVGGLPVDVYGIGGELCIIFICDYMRYCEVITATLFSLE